MLMKTLLITISLFAATLTANAHCGGCGTGEKAHTQDKAAKSCCSESSSCYSEKKHVPKIRSPVAPKKNRAVVFAATTRSARQIRMATTKNLAAQAKKLPRPPSQQSPCRRFLAAQQTRKEKINLLSSLVA